MLFELEILGFKRRQNRILRRTIMSQNKPSEIDLHSYSVKLQLSLKTQKKTIGIISDAENAGLTVGSAPESIVAAALYIAGILENEPRTLADIGEATGVSQHTVQRQKTRLVRELSIRKQ